MKRWMLIGSFVLVIALVAGAGYLGVRSVSGDDGVAEAPPQTIPVTRGDVQQTVTAPGYLIGTRQVDLAMEVSGRLVEVVVQPGDRVLAGDLLARVDPASLERAVTQAKANLLVAQKDLEKVQTPYSELDRVQARLAVEQAEVELQDAREALEEVQNSPTELELAQAQLAVEQARVGLEDAQDALDDLQAPSITSAQTAVRDAEAVLQIAKNRLVAVENDTENAAKLRTLENEAGWYRNHYWLSVQKHERGEISKSKLDQEYLNMIAADEKLRAAKATAEAALASARNEVARAEAALSEAQHNLADLKKGPDPLKVEEAKAQVTQAEQNLAQAKEQLATIQQGPDPVEIKRAEAQIMRAEYNLARAKETQAEMEAGPDPEEIEIAQAKLDSAQANLAEAQAALEAAVLSAPFDGTVLDVKVAAGDVVVMNASAVTLIDPNAVEARVTVIEEDWPLVQVGQQVEVFLDAQPEEIIKGRIARLIPSREAGSDRPLYPAYLSLSELPEGLALGMTVDASIVIESRADVLCLPRSLVRSLPDGTAKVPVWNGVSTETRIVQVGLRGDTLVEIVSGLEEGDQVVSQ